MKSASKLRTVSEVYEHDDYGSMVLTWLVGPGHERKLVAVQPGLFTPAEEVQALLDWAKTKAAQPGGFNDGTSG